MSDGHTEVRGTLLALVETGADPDPGRALAMPPWEVEVVSAPGDLLGRLSAPPPVDLVLLSLGTSGVNAGLVREVQARLGQAELVLTTPRSTLEAVRLARESGDLALLHEPLDPGVLAPYLRRRDAPDAGVPFSAAPEPRSETGFVVPGKATARVLDQVLARALDGGGVRFLGEAGTGREAMARVLHQASRRRHGPFVTVDCAALPEALLERELFGVSKGDSRTPPRPGRVERAEGGTLFLRELSAAGPALQGRIREMLETFHFERPGGRGVVPVDVRVVACDLEHRDEANASDRPPDTGLRSELLSDVVSVLPLRHRLDEVIPLALHFGREAAEGRGRRLEGIGGEALDLLRAHSWPGNLRELRFVMERAVFRARGPWIGGGELGLEEGAAHLGSGGRAEAGYPPTRSLAEVERDHIAKVLRYTGGAMGRTAELLGIHRNTLTRKVEQYELRTDPEEGRDG